MIQSESTGQAKTYFDQALIKSDYYLGNQELNGTFRGKLSARLGITGMVTKDAFHALCDNRHPYTGKPLTPRTKKERTVGYDISFHVPKSVSILHALSGDTHVLDAFQSAVNSTMQVIELDTKTRVRKGGVSTDRLTSEILYVDFVHQTARPVDGFAPDPHLHAHCYVFNMTWDDVEKCLKAGKFDDTNREMPFYQALFHKTLADNLMKLGYQVRPTGKSFEVEGISKDVIALFSKRTDEIGRVAKEKGITDAKELAELGARTRAKKQQGLSMAELKADWQGQIDAINGQVPAVVRSETAPIVRPLRVMDSYRQTDARECADYALSHCFERASVVPFNRLALTALKQSIGRVSTSADIIQSLKDHEILLRVQERNKELCTTKEVLAEERRMVHLANQGRNKYAPMYNVSPELKSTGQQADAIRHILTTTDMVSIVRGAAGAGKTTLMKEALPLIEAARKNVVVVAPGSNTARTHLRKEGFEEAETVKSLLDNPKQQEQLRNAVLWVDEAGMLGSKDMVSLLELTTKYDARLILGGDTRQHASVVRGDALRILNTVGGIDTAEVNKIYRQKADNYRNAVKSLSEGDIAKGFALLDDMGAIYEGPTAENYRHLTDRYLKALKDGKEALIISPTHDQGEKLTEALRVKLREAGRLGRKEIVVDRLKDLNLTEAEKTDWRNFQEGMVVQFNQNRKGIKRGSAWVVASSSRDGVEMQHGREKQKLALERTGDFSVFQKKPLALSKGDKVQITKNGFDKEKTRLNNGTMLEISSVSKSGDILATTSGGKATYKLDRNFGHMAHAHVITSHKSQGLTVDEIFVAQPTATFPATDAKQFYVSVSRAREQVYIYTDDKDVLLARASDVGDRRGATELMQSVEKDVEREIRNREIEQNILPSSPDKHHIDKEPTDDYSVDFDSYEPGF